MKKKKVQYISDDCFFFFKQKTAYEMRISDWSSDVCSSDLAGDQPHGRGIDMVALCVQYERVADMRVEDFGDDDELTRPGLHAVKRPAFKARRHRRSEERSVG